MVFVDLFRQGPGFAAHGVPIWSHGNAIESAAAGK